MSFVRLDSGEFPPLGQSSRQSQGKKAKRATRNMTTPGSNSDLNVPSRNNALDNTDNNKINSGNDFVKSRVGYRVNEYHYDLAHVLKVNYIGHRRGDFIVAPIERTESWFNKKRADTLADLVLPFEVWNSRVALELGQQFDSDNFDQFEVEEHFEKMIRHALYLSSPVIIINYPDCDSAFINIAAIVNQRLKETRSRPLVLFKVSAFGESQTVAEELGDMSFSCPTIKSLSGSSSDFSDTEQILIKGEADNNSGDEPTSESGIATGSRENSASQGTRSGSPTSRNFSWAKWNALRQYLHPDTRVGVCLVLDDDFPNDDEELRRWAGEPVRMIIIDTDQFTRSPGSNNALQLNTRCKEFVTKVALANSLKTSFVINGRPKEDIAEYLQYMDYMVSNIKEVNNEPLLEWNDKIQPPLQPLSCNLDSSTYGVFEMDSKKYLQYRDAMIAAIKKLTINEINPDRKFITMVLGAGRGPLVDCLISAIKTVNSKSKFKIFALDKNPSSVLSLQYKEDYVWVDLPDSIELEVVEADMRDWNPGVKADIVATELLGSLGDNELSPECIDGLWRFSTPTTISIPDEYASFIAPLCSYRLQQELHNVKSPDNTPFDQVYVVRINNCYHIDYPQELFKFEHKDLSLKLESRCNKRYTKLVFWSKIDTICHGFAGYFIAHLFGDVSISTHIDRKTPNMDSWFPAFIPLEQPVPMPKDTKLEVHFWRKESNSSVWYQWAISSPVRSRVHTQYGLNSAMSKMI